MKFDYDEPYMNKKNVLIINDKESSQDPVKVFLANLFQFVLFFHVFPGIIYSYARENHPRTELLHSRAEKYFPHTWKSSPAREMS